MTMKWLSHAGSELSLTQEHLMPGSPSSSISLLSVKQISTSPFRCPLEVSMTKCEQESEKLAWTHVALICGHLETAGGYRGTEARKGAEEEEER